MLMNTYLSQQHAGLQHSTAFQPQQQVTMPRAKKHPYLASSALVNKTTALALGFFNKFPTTWNFRKRNQDMLNTLEMDEWGSCISKHQRQNFLVKQGCDLPT